MMQALTNGRSPVKTFLASEIAERIRQQGEDPVRVLNRIRNWTKLGLLPPFGQAHPGGGRACVYSEAALLDAMLLQELVNAGIPAVQAAPLLQQIKSEVPQLFTAAKPRAKAAERTLLVLGKVYSGSNAFNISLRSADSFAEFASRHLCSLYYVIDIAKLRDRLGVNEQ